MGIADSETEKRNARLPRQNQLAALESMARLSSSPRERAAALGAYAQLAGGFDQGQTQQQIAAAREAGDTTRAISANSINQAIHRDANATAQRGQDIGLQSHQIATQGAQTIEGMRAASAKDVAGITSEGRIEASVNRAQRPIALRGGQVPYTDPATGLTTMMQQPDRFVDPSTGQEVQPAARPTTQAKTPPPDAISKLVSNPKLAADFDAKYGAGASARALSGK